MNPSEQRLPKSPPPLHLRKGELGAELCDLPARRRRQSCPGFESIRKNSVAVETSTPGSALSSPGQPASLSHGEGVYLANLMRRRRENCAEFESVPGDSIADAAAWIGDRVSSSGSQQRIDSVCSVRRSTTSDEQLRDWLAQMRGRCEVLENTPKPPVADAMWSQRSPIAPTEDPSVLESTPAPCAADARWECVPPRLSMEAELVGGTGERRRGSARLWKSEFVTESAPEATTADASAASSEVDSAVCATRCHLVNAVGPETLRGRLKSGLPLPRSLRPHAWAEQLQVTNSGGSLAARAVAAIFAATDETTGDACAELAGAFAERHLAWLGDVVTSSTESVVAASSCREAVGQPASFLASCVEDVPAPIFVTLAQLLRYHCPVACAPIEVYSGNGDLAEALHGIFDGTVGLLRFLFTPGDAVQNDALLLACDRSVMDKREVILLFTVLVLLIEASQTSGASVSPERLRKAVMGLGARGGAGVARCMDRANELYDSTPLSTINRLGSTGSGNYRGGQHLPFCAVSPDEVLMHIYESPSASWRLVIVDVRCGSAAFALPVCMRLGHEQDRIAILRDLPFEESIHLCLIADAEPAFGDEAFELCRQLTGPPYLRKHLSVACGGWPSIESLAESMGLELMRVEPEVPSAAAGATAASVGHRVAKSFFEALGFASASEPVGGGARSPDKVNVDTSQFIST
eukprot:TRINITY_DN43055_c0_g1_i1.p1 TRINITY_DN43055_c0_g1~~TRINITY_DN43055_c0_g1_i1.p1  ORF type:complete len:695 (+),score=122.35 TRINITY_DN43055_c0_g1_i1:423-2507(+)